MQGRWKRNAVVGTMAILVCAAVGLNWKYAEKAGNTTPNTITATNTAETSTTDENTKILGEAKLVSESEKNIADIDMNEGKALPSEESIYTGSDYFASARLTRQQARDSAISLLQEAAEQENANETVANEASEGIQALASYTLQEAQIENLVTAKGYKDCVAFIGDESVSIVVSTDSGELSNEDVAKIMDIAVSETGFSASGIKIMAAS